MTINAPKGTYDILPYEIEAKEAWQRTALWHYLESQLLAHTALYGFKEIRTPVFEKLEVFQRGVGQDTDIVMKEMFVFDDRAGRTMVLRPEGTAAVMRAFIENHIQQIAGEHKLYYYAPMFRYERPQAGRYRQHIQFGAEIIGNPHPEQDAEAIAFLFNFYQRLGIQGCVLLLNSVGNSHCRASFKKDLKDYLTPYKAELSADSQVRLELNPLRILDSKDPDDQRILNSAPLLSDYLDDECKEHHERLKQLLHLMQIPFQDAPRLVRGLDYYNKTVFEITSNALGAQNTLGAGGRYDGLLKTLGGPDLPAVGFGTGIERVLLTLITQNKTPREEKGAEIYFIPLGESALNCAIGWLQQVRSQGVAAQMDFSKKKLKDALRQAVHLRAKFVAILGDDELEKNQFQVKELDTHSTQMIAFDELIPFLQKQRTHHV